MPTGYWDDVRDRWFRAESILEAGYNEKGTVIKKVRWPRPDKPVVPIVITGRPAAGKTMLFGAMVGRPKVTTIGNAVEKQRILVRRRRRRLRAVDSRGWPEAG